MQHTWASISHDLGYKSEFGVPRVVAREFARVAGLLEIADDEFVRVRDGMKAYADDIRQRITENRADDVLIDLISLREFLQRNGLMRAFTQALTDICGSEIDEISPEPYLAQLSWLGMKTLGDLQQLLERNRDLALVMAKEVLDGAELDILSSNVGLRFLCRAELCQGKYSLEEVTEFLRLSTANQDRAQRQAERLLARRDALKERPDEQR